jgi:hypothetical protein
MFANNKLLRRAQKEQPINASRKAYIHRLGSTMPSVQGIHGEKRRLQSNDMHCVPGDLLLGMFASVVRAFKNDRKSTHVQYKHIEKAQGHIGRIQNEQAIVDAF